MELLKIEGAKHTPYICFDPEKHQLEITGESYPENTSEFFGRIFDWLNEYLAGINDETVTVNVKLYYFNSSSSKILMDFFTILDDAAADGKNIVANWFYEADLEEGLEYGEDFQEDIESMKFNLIEIEE